MTSPVRTEWISIAPGFAGYLAKPPAGSGPGLLLYQEIFGVNSHIRAVAEQYALAGFVVLAPDVFWRQAPRVELGYEGEQRQRGMGLIQSYNQADAVPDIQAAAAALRARPEAAGAKLGAAGYCLGGRLAYLAAASAGVDAAAAFYGGGIHNQLDLAPAVRCPIQFHYAGQDDHIPPAAVESVRQAFAGRKAEVFVYEGAMHGFNCWDRASYQPAAAALSHGRALAFLAAELF